MIPTGRPSRPRSRNRWTARTLGLSLLAVGAVACAGPGSAPDGHGNRPTPTDPALTFDLARHAGLTASLTGSGSTFQRNYINAAIGVLASPLPGLKIDYAGGGSGQGKSDLADGTVDFAGTDSAIGAADRSRFRGRVLHFPTVVAPITVSYNLDGADGLNLDGPALARIFSGEVATWDDPAIQALNPAYRLPSTPVNVCRRSDASGTTMNFSRFLTSAGGAAWTLGVGDALVWPPGTQGAAGNGGVAQCIKGKDGSIGYVDLSDARSQGLTSAAIRNEAGEFVAPTPAGASAAAAHAEVADDLTYDPIDTGGRGVYPITSPTWIVVRAKQPDRATGTAIKAFLEFILTDGQDPSFTASVSYAPLPEGLARRALTQLAEVRVP